MDRRKIFYSLAVAVTLARSWMAGLPSALASDGVTPETFETSVGAFEQATEAARQPDSGGGASVTRAELRNAIAFFLHDDGTVDSTERAHLASYLADADWLEAISGPARRYAAEFAELNAEGAPLPVAAMEVQASLVDVFGAAGALISSIWIKEGRVLGNGLVNQATLRAAYGRAFNASASTFDPINVRELLNELSGRLEAGTPTQDEVDGAVAYLSQIGRSPSRLYLASWIGSSRGGAPGDLGGVVIAAVSSDRRFVRFVEVHVWTE